MDHTPGRGQYHDTPSWRVAMRARTGADDQALDAWLSWLPADPVTVRHRARAVAALAAEFDLPFASHDDATPTDAQEAADHGATISEFPLTRGAADAAHAAGLAVVMGAPNAWRGRSHLTGLSARDALRAGTLDALTSDYHTAALVRAAVVLAADEVCPLPTSVHLVTAGPAPSGRPHRRQHHTRAHRRRHLGRRAPHPRGQRAGGESRSRWSGPRTMSRGDVNVQSSAVYRWFVT
jgi:alpha-D-ribose 1-methylphosphonate 5-triphosphate diphosphatase